MREEEQTIQALIRPSRPLGRVVVSVVDGKARGLCAELLPGVPVCVGKSPDNQLVLDDMTVSRYHLELTLRRGDIEVCSNRFAAINETRGIVPPRSTSLREGISC